VNGGTGPLSLNELPLTVTCDTVSVEPPVLLMLTYWVAAEPAGMLPKETDAGDTSIWGAAGIGALLPVPLIARVADACELSVLVREILPASVPTLFGANVTANGTVAPGFSVRGTARPLRPKSAPATVAAAIVTGLLPGFDRIAFCEATLPTETLPKAIPFGENDTE
jgi:hypothetical protein